MKIHNTKIEHYMDFSFDLLVQKIEQAQYVLQNSARLVVNRHVTTKAWLTGYYIVEYEQHGLDRAQYGENIIKNLSQRLGGNQFSPSTLKIYRQFYLTYPQLLPEISHFLLPFMQKGQSLTDQLQLPSKQPITISQSLTDQFKMQSEGSYLVAPEDLFNRLSFTHLVTLLPIEDTLKRAFYETMAIKGTWSVRELERQIDTNLYERSGYSNNPNRLVELTNNKAEIATLSGDIKSPYIFEFLGLKAKDVVEESDLESAIIDHLQEFILELGMGFCFEERQKKMLIDDRYYKADLVFYHRILKRHVIIELKAHRLDYSDATQLKLYLAYYRKHIMRIDDNPPIGILMCTEVGQEMAEYLATDMDKEVFISKYHLDIPNEQQMRQFLEEQNKE